VSSSRDGATVVTAQMGGVLRVWEIKQGVLNERNPVRAQTLLSASKPVSPDGRFAVVTKERADAVLLNLADLTERELPAVGDFARFGPDGSVLTTSGSGTRVRRAPDFAAAEKFVDGFVPHVFSPDGKWLACTSETELGIWDAPATLPRALWKVPGISAQRVDFTPDGRYLIARFCHPPHGMKVRAWAMATSGPKLRYETDSFAPSYWESLSPDGRTLAVCEHFDGLCLYDIDQGVPKAKRKFVAGLFNACHYSPNGRLLFVWDGTVVKVLDATTGERLYQPELRGAALGALWHPDGKHIFVTNADRTTYILRLPKAVLATLDDPDRRAMDYVFAVGGALSVPVGDEVRSVGRAAELPAGSAFPYMVSLEYKKNLTPETLAIFRDCRRLVGFNAHSTEITDEALAIIAAHTGLKHLDLHVCPRVTDAGLAPFKNCKQIEHLNLAQARQVTDAGLAHFADCANLTFLDVRETKVTPGKIAAFAKALPNCKIVHDGGVIEPKPVPKAGADDRETAKYVLQVGGRVRARTATETVPVFKLEELPAGPLAVTYLELTNKDLSDDGWQRIAGLRALKELTINGPSFTDARATKFDCPEVEELRITGTKVGDRGLAALVAGKKLRRANVGITPVGDDGAKALAACPDLIDLTLTKTAVTDAGLAHLAGAKKLIWLHLNDTAITDAGLKHLEALQALRQLSLKNTTVTEPALKALKLKLHPDCQIDWDKGTVKP